MDDNRTLSLWWAPSFSDEYRIRINGGKQPAVSRGNMNRCYDQYYFSGERSIFCQLKLTYVTGTMQDIGLTDNAGMFGMMTADWSRVGMQYFNGMHKDHY